MYRVYYLQNFKIFLTKDEYRPNNKWIEKYPIITIRKFQGDYESLRTKLHYEYGIDNVRSDEDYFDSLVLSFVDKYNYTVRLEEYEKILNQNCDKCGYWGHFQHNCTEQEDILGHSIFENLEFIDDNDLYKEDWDNIEPEEEEYTRGRRGFR